MARRPTFNARQLMERAVEVMHASIAEPRGDGKASPLVGTVIWKPDGTIETACRGELRDGDHAEFTLLERKNRNSNLGGAILFATLEPCAPGARHYPKLGCAERIVAARIREVWVGIPDPDPKVDRKGIKYLQDKGVTVHMFDRDLQDVIAAANADFVAQAIERAKAAGKRKPEVVTLSTLENPLENAQFNEFSLEALDRYRSVARIEDAATSARFRDRFVQQGLLAVKGNRAVPTGFGLLLFGREPRMRLPQSGLLATIHYPDGSEEPKDFDGPLILIPELVERWLSDKLPNVVDRSSMQRRTVSPVPFEMIRESVVNALVHRDYDVRQGKCQLVITTNTITVKSPGGPLSPISLAELQSFNAPMLSRNPELHYAFAKMELAEERGLGIKSLKSRAIASRLPLPKYSWEDPYLVLTIFRSRSAASEMLAPEALAALSPTERLGWQWLTTAGKVKSSQYAKEIRLDERTGRRHLNHFLALGLVRKTGAGPSTMFEAK